MGRKEEAYQYLKEAIVSNRLVADQPISELAIAEELKMSRSPIREAMRALESEGLIVSYPSRGSFVASLSPYDVEEIYALRVLLESWALERSICRIPDSGLDEVERLFKNAQQNSDWEMRHLADRKLHGMIIENAGSKRLVDFMNILNGQMERIRRISASDESRSEVSYREHMEIIAYLRTRDIEKTKDALVSHLRSVANSAIEAAKYQIAYGQNMETIGR